MRSALLHTTLFLTALLVGCSDMDGDGVRDGRDCLPDDARGAPGLVEVCDGVDNDCDGYVDEGVSMVAYRDQDRDGYGSEARRVCSWPEGAAEVGGDCDDEAAHTWPGADEICDGVDNDCDGEVDEGVTEIWYADADGDGHGVDVDTVAACWQPAGYAPAADDCDDTDPAAWDDAPELCDGVDNDCDGDVDEDLATIRLWVDADGDRGGDPGAPTTGCGPAPGLADNPDDCDDTDPTVGPFADEVAGSGVDEDCDGYVDEVAVPTHYPTVAEALAATPDGSVIQLDRGTYRGTVDLRGRDVTLAGHGCGATVLYAEGEGSAVVADAGTVTGLTLGGGLATYGGGLLVEGDVTASAVCFLSNRAIEGGGAAAVTAGSLTLEDCRVSGNQSAYQGGGVWAGPGTSVTAVRTGFAGNYATTDGGGLMLAGASGDLRASWFAGNTAASDGGAVAAQRTDDLRPVVTGDHLTLVANAADRRGSGVYAQHADIELTDLLAAHHDEVLLYATYANFTVDGAGLYDVAEDTRSGWLAATRGEPGFVSLDGDPAAWDLRLGPDSAFVEGGELGAFGGPDAPADADWARTVDTDGDGLLDAWELAGGHSPWLADADLDLDGDGLDGTAEAAAGSDPLAADTDADGVPDGADALPADPRDHLPVAEAGPDQWALVGELVEVASSSWDPDRTALAATWSLAVPGSSALAGVDDPTAAATGFVPDVAGTYTLTLTVDDGTATATDTLTVLVVDAVVVPDEASTLAEAATLAGDGGWIALRPGTWAEPLDLGGASLGILGLGGPGEVVLDAEHGDRVLTAALGEHLTAAQLTLRGGRAPSGGCLWASGGSVDLHRVVLTDCAAEGVGGGLLAEDAEVRLREVTVRGGRAATGAGVALTAGAVLEADDLTLWQNAATEGGGGLWLDGGVSRHTLSRPVFQANSAPRGAALLATQSGETLLTHGVIAEHAGQGAVRVEDTSFVRVQATVVAGHADGPALSREDGSALLSAVLTAWDQVETEVQWPEDDCGSASRGPLGVVRWSDDGDPTNDLWAPLPGSPLVDAALPAWADPDGSRADVGPWGGPGAPRHRFLHDDDGDGMSDGWELLVGLSPDVDDGASDGDGDGLDALTEYGLGTDPSLADSDADGVNDATEVATGSDPADPSDHRPVADAGDDLRVEAGTPALLDGSGSYDPDGTEISWSWSLQWAPAGSALTDADLVDGDTATPTLVPDVRGVYRLELVVGDGSATSVADTVDVGVYGTLRVPSEWSLADALADATPDDTVLLEAGVHTAPVVTPPVDITLAGEGVGLTVLSPPPGELAIDHDNEATVLVRDLTVSGAVTRTGAVYCRESTLHMERVSIEDSLSYQGGGVYLTGCTADLVDVDLVRNSSAYNGGGLYALGSDLTWTRGRVADNTSGTGGAGLYAYNTDSVLSNLVLEGNLAGTSGGAAAFSSGTAALDHLTVADNDGSYGALYYVSANGSVRHTVVTGSTSYGLYVTGRGTVDEAWGAYWGNEDGPSYDPIDSTSLTVDPEFADADLRLGALSPLVDAGDPLADPDPDGTTADLGAWGGPDAGLGWDLWLEDLDADGMADAWERSHGLDPHVDDASLDADGDGLDNGTEHDLGTDPQLADTDGDGAADGAEVGAGTDPTAALLPLADAGGDHTAAAGDTVTLDGTGSTDPGSGTLTYAWTLEEAPGRSALTGVADAASATASLTPDTAGLYVVELRVTARGLTSAPDRAEIRVAGDLLVPDDYADVTSAVDAATSGATVEIAAGVWPTRVSLDGKDLTLVGAGRELTWLDGEGLGRVIDAPLGEQVVLRDLSLTSGHAAHGAGLRLLSGATVDMEGVGIEACEAVSGGAIYVELGSVVGSEVWMVDNAAARYGGGVYLMSSQLDLERSVLAVNRSTSLYGGAIYAYPGDVDLVNVVLSENSATHGGAMYLGGTSAASSTGWLEHVTATGNVGSTAGGVMRLHYADAAVTHSILAHSRGRYAVAASSTGTNTYVQDWTLVWDNDSDHWNVPVALGADGNTEADPLLWGWLEDGAWAGDDWALEAGSPAIDGGDPAGATDPDGSIADLGAFGGPLGGWAP